MVRVRTTLGSWVCFQPFCYGLSLCKLSSSVISRRFIRACLFLQEFKNNSSWVPSQMFVGNKDIHSARPCLQSFLVNPGKRVYYSLLTTRLLALVHGRTAEVLASRFLLSAAIVGG